MRPTRRSARNARALLSLALLGAALTTCTAPSPPRPDGGVVGAPAARSWPEADALFRRDARWLGADAALSIELGAERVLWLFGDTFVARTAANVRRESVMVRNTVAVQSGESPVASASVTFHWRAQPDGAPASFFAERGDRWHWPGHGVRLAEGPLFVWLFVLRPTPGEGLGFAADGWRIARIDAPDEPPDRWSATLLDGPPTDFDATPATAVLREGEHVVALAIRNAGVHAGYLVRWRVADLLAGDLARAEWWRGAAEGWVMTAQLAGRVPAAVIDDAGAECSLHYDAAAQRYVHVASYGFGASTIGVRTAPALTGPWSAPTQVFTPPESQQGARPFVYAAKAHPEQRGVEPGELVVTYATNSFEFGDLFTPDGSERLYWPRFVRVALGP